MLRLTNIKDDRGRPEWLVVIHEANGIEPDLFGEPISTGAWWAGGYVEEYADARVVLDEDSARISSKTERGERVLREVAKQMGIHHA